MTFCSHGTSGFTLIARCARLRPSVADRVPKLHLDPRRENVNGDVGLGLVEFPSMPWVRFTNGVLQHNQSESRDIGSVNYSRQPFAATRIQGSFTLPRTVTVVLFVSGPHRNSIGR